MAVETEPMLACVGDNCVDAYLLADPGVTAAAGAGPTPVEFAGGNAFNVAVSLARAGSEVAYLGAVGDDERSEVILDAGRRAGVDLERVVRLPGSTGRTVVDRDPQGERLFVSEDYGVAADYRLDSDTVAWLGSRTWVHFARQADLSDWLDTLQEAPARLSCDLGIPGGVDQLEHVAGHMDVVFMSAAACGLAVEELIGRALRAGAGLVVVTSGADGSIAAAPDAHWAARAVPVSRVVDTLGAGDAYIAAFIEARTRGMEVDDAMRAGATAGAAACARWGLAGPLQADGVAV